MSEERYDERIQELSGAVTVLTEYVSIALGGRDRATVQRTPNSVEEKISGITAAGAETTPFGNGSLNTLQRIRDLLQENLSLLREWFSDN